MTLHQPNWRRVDGRTRRWVLPVQKACVRLHRRGLGFDEVADTLTRQFGAFFSGGSVAYFLLEVGVIGAGEIEEYYRDYKNAKRRRAYRRRGGVRGNVKAQVRLDVLARDEHTCRYCGSLARSVDHLVPAVEGGCGESYNLVACCLRCNSVKGARFLVSFVPTRELGVIKFSMRGAYFRAFSGNFYWLGGL